jgi:ABC-2 type transport system ATP-binding protein
MNELIEVKGLEKSFRGNRVIDGISFEVRRGEILCFLGPNGAGKTTTINILTGALGRGSGEITCEGQRLGRDLRGFKQRLGIVPQELAIYEDITARQNIKFFASLYGLRGSLLGQRTAEALEFAGLSKRADEKVKTFSGGMKRRLNVACAVAHHPELLIMDEPTVGIDPQSRNHILRSIKRLREDGMTVIYTTHYMEEVEEISTRIIIMDNGAIIAEGTKESLKEGYESEKRFIIEVDDISGIDTGAFFTIEGVRSARAADGRVEITTLKSVENLDKIISLIIGAPARINNISCQTASLETLFLKLTGKSLRD